MASTRGFLTWILLLARGAVQTEAQETGGGSELSLDELLNIEISSAAKYSQTATEAAASVTVITRDDISRYGYRTLSDALVQVRGFYGSYDRNYFYLGARGFGRPTDYNNRVLFLMDGQPFVVMRDASLAFETAGSTPGGEAISVIPLSYSDRAGLLASLRSEKIDLIYIAPLLGTAISGILDASEEAQVLTSTGVPEFVEEGVAVGIGSRGGKPQIVINRDASIAQGAEFSSDLLNVARIVSGPLNPVSVPFSHRE